MKDFSLSKIYMIYSPNTDEVYVGATTSKHLCCRWANHTSDYRNQKHFSGATKIFDCGDAQIKLIENFPCSNSIELRQRENYWIENTPNCININKAYTSKQEALERTKVLQRIKYHNDEEYKKNKRQYYLDNKERIKRNSLNYYYKKKLRRQLEEQLSKL